MLIVTFEYFTEKKFARRLGRRERERETSA